MKSIQRNRIKEITELHIEISSLLMTALQKGIRIGELLTKQKEELPYGHFTQWVEDNLPFTKRSAQEYMRFYENRQLLEEHHVQTFRDAKKLLQGKDSDTTPENNQETKHVSLLNSQTIKLTKAEDRFITSVEACGGSKDKAFRLVMEQRQEKDRKAQERKKDKTDKKLKYTVMFTKKEHKKIEREAKKEGASIADVIRKFINTIS